MFSENRAVYEIVSKNVVEPEAINDVTVWRICIACELVRLYASRRMHTPTLPGNHTRKYPRTSALTHRQI